VLSDAETAIKDVMTAPQTLLKAWNLRAKKAYGQNFLVDPATAERIVRQADLDREDLVLEIGAGLGALTLPLAARVRRLVAVEKDGDLIQLLRNELLAAGRENTTVVHADILRADLAALVAPETGPVVVMGNLPYNISSQVVLKLLASRALVARAVFMFQKELADRLAAPPGNKTYGRLSVMLQYCADVNILTEIAATCFHPRPKVASAILEIRFKAVPDTPAHDEALLLRIVRAAFGKRRKTLKNALTQSDLQLEGAAVATWLQGAGIDPRRRAETLSVVEYVTLANRFPGTPS
jgi:16S rRNA (adenine1518-N6/adenine1519-N6)-dimethyltransferase